MCLNHIKPSERKKILLRLAKEVLKYNQKRAPNALEGMPLRLYPLQPEDQAHLDSIKVYK